MRKISSFFKYLWVFLKKTQINPVGGILGLILLAFFVGAVVFQNSKNIPVNFATIKIPQKVFKKTEDGKKVYIPGSISMNRMKTRGCVADGILSEYGEDTDEAVALINRSKCEYLHRALETWAHEPDFEKAREIMEKINRPGIIYGMFISEAIDKKAKVYFPEKERYAKFSEMCRKGSENAWGEHTCKPSLSREEYRYYVIQMSKQAMDLGIQSFLFGQIHYQESGVGKDPAIPKVLKEMREYAKEKNMEIVIGAQTNSITDEKYLDLFDYIEGGVGIDEKGNVENGPCLSTKGSCWALLWHTDFSKKAKNVFLHLDWSGLKYDDMSKFARMEKDDRERTLRSLYQKFISQDMGFLMPYLAVINKNNGGCYGPKKRFYSPSEKYTCGDEKIITKIFEGK